MKTSAGLASLLLAFATITVPARAEDANEAVQVRATLELQDGSRLVGVPLEKVLSMKLDFTEANIPLEKIRQCEIRHKDGRVVLNLVNGDRLTGVLALNEFKLETAMGKLSPDLAQIDRMTFSASRGGSLPAGEGEINFGGVNWHGWKMSFAVQGDKLASLPQSRPGFNYGHSGGGRGPYLVSNVGNTDWRDYRIDCVFCVPGIDPAFNPYGLGSDFHDGSIWFHVADAKENWNERGGSLYRLGLGGNGSWTLSCTYNSYCQVPMGYGNPHSDADRKLAAGDGLNPDRVNGNHFRIEVRGQRIQVWVDDRQIADVTDEKMDEPIGGQTLDHGGVAFVGEFDAMIWIKNFSATRL
jgi:hypothetical protein